MAKRKAFTSLTLKSRPRRSPLPDVTPIVNVALVLLIVFMVVMPIIQEGITVDTPEAENATEIVEQGKEYLVLSIQEDGAVFIDMREVEPGQLREELTREFQGKEEFPIIIKGARNLPYSEILRLIEICQNVGASGVELMAKKKTENGS